MVKELIDNILDKYFNGVDECYHRCRKDDDSYYDVLDSGSVKES